MTSTKVFTEIPTSETTVPCCPLCGFQLLPTGRRSRTASIISNDDYCFEDDDDEEMLLVSDRQSHRTSSDRHNQGVVLPGVCSTCIRLEQSILLDQHQPIQDTMDDSHDDPMAITPSSSSSLLPSQSRRNRGAGDHHRRRNHMDSIYYHSSLPSLVGHDTTTDDEYDDTYNDDPMMMMMMIDDRPQQQEQLHSPTSSNSSLSYSSVVYIGEYNRFGKRHGDYGELYWPNGDRYVGSFVNGVRQGQGTFFFMDGTESNGTELCVVLNTCCCVITPLLPCSDGWLVACMVASCWNRSSKDCVNERLYHTVS
jgi:hypothetical protein